MKVLYISTQYSLGLIAAVISEELEVQPMMLTSSPLSFGSATKFRSQAQAEDCFLPNQ